MPGNKKTAQRITAAAAARLVQAGDRVVVGHSGAVAQNFLKALTDRTGELTNVDVIHSRMFGPADYLDARCSQSFFHNSLMINANTQQAMLEGRADYVAYRYGMLPSLMQDGYLRPDITVLQLAPPDPYGYVSYGICSSYLHGAAAASRIVIGEINDQAPFSYGIRVHISDLDYVIEASYPLLEVQQQTRPPGEVETRIGQHVASLIEDGATLQIGVGAIPDAIMSHLTNHRDLGLHSETFSDGVLNLVEKGVLNGRLKTLHRGKMIATFVLGSQSLYQFMHHNPIAEIYPVEYTNDPAVIARNNRMVAINSALEVDVTGQICAESIGTMFISGVGGQLDFALGALISPGGRFIVAMPSTAAGGKVSRIVAQLQPGAAVTTPRTLADYVVTEYGVAALRGKNFRQRAKALIAIAHPDFREGIERAALARQDVNF